MPGGGPEQSRPAGSRMRLGADLRMASGLPASYCQALPIAVILALVLPVQQFDARAEKINRFDVGRVYPRRLLSQTTKCKHTCVIGIGGSLVLASANALEEIAQGRNSQVQCWFRRRV